jgi:hypothetical protein
LDRTSKFVVEILKGRACHHKNGQTLRGHLVVTPLDTITADGIQLPFRQHEKSRARYLISQLGWLLALMNSQGHLRSQFCKSK